MDTALQDVKCFAVSNITWINERSTGKAMSNVRRVYVEKKPAFAVKAKELKHEISSYLGIKTVTAVRVLIRYPALKTPLRDSAQLVWK